MIGKPTYKLGSSFSDAEQVKYDGQDHVLVRDEDVLLSYSGEETCT